MFYIWSQPVIRYDFIKSHFWFGVEAEGKYKKGDLFEMVSSEELSYRLLTTNKYHIIIHFAIRVNVFLFTQQPPLRGTRLKITLPSRST